MLFSFAQRGVAWHENITFAYGMSDERGKNMLVQKLKDLAIRVATLEALEISYVKYCMFCK